MHSPINCQMANSFLLSSKKFEFLADGVRGNNSTAIGSGSIGDGDMGGKDGLNQMAGGQANGGFT